jgi:hypothetical protein
MTLWLWRFYSRKLSYDQIATADYISTFAERLSQGCTVRTTLVLYTRIFFVDVLK